MQSHNPQNKSQKKPTAFSRKRIAAIPPEQLKKELGEETTNSSSEHTETKTTIAPPLPFFTNPTALLRTRTDLTTQSYGPGPFQFQNTEYKLLTHEVNILKERYLVSMGHVGEKGETREFILLDMESSALSLIYREFLNQITTTPVATESEKETKEELPALLEKKALSYIPDLLAFVNKQFNPAFSEEAIKKFVSEDNTLNLETAIENKIGCCRHKALLVSYLLSKLIKTFSARNEVDTHQEAVYHARSLISNTYPTPNNKNVKYFAHTGIVYVAADKKTYFLDANAQDIQGNMGFFEFGTNKNCFSETYRFYKKFWFINFWNHLIENFSEKSNHQFKLVDVSSAKLGSPTL